MTSFHLYLAFFAIMLILSAVLFFYCGASSDEKFSATSQGEAWIQALGLEPHPEGGFFKVSYRSQITAPNEDLPDNFSGERVLAGSIYYLLIGEDFSALHTLQQDELWAFHDGTGLIIDMLDAEGTHSQKSLGKDPTSADQPQVLVPAGRLFAASVRDGGYALVSCVTIPGFDFADWEMPSRKSLLETFPQRRELVTKLTRP